MRRNLALAALLAATAACSTPRDSLPDIANIYKDAALNEARNPVVVIHGILGARLGEKATGRTVWGAFTDDYADPATPDGSRAVALPIDRLPGPADRFDPSAEAIVATGPLETLKLSLLFSIISVDVYKNIIRTLGAGGYRDQMFSEAYGPRYADYHFTCHSFWYDWRRDNVANAIELGRFLRRARTAIQRDAKAHVLKLRADPTAKNLAEADQIEAWLERGFRFDVVAHSMGGLIARYYLRYGEQDLPADGREPEVTWAGAKEIDRLIMVGTPNLGSIDALRQLTQGFQPSFVLPYYDQAVLGSMPSIYQLLPRARHKLTLRPSLEPVDVDFFDPDVWNRHRWGLLDPAAAKTLAWLLPGVADPDARRDKARAYLAWCLSRARAFHRAMDKKPASPSPAEIYLFAADSQPTLARTVLRRRGGRLVPTFPEIDRLLVPGDVTVPRYSAIGDEREGGPFQFGVRTNIEFKNVTFLSDDHIGLTRNPHFSNNMLHILLERQPPVR